MLNNGGLSVDRENSAVKKDCKYCLQFSGTAIICLRFEQELLFYYEQIYQLNGLLIGKFSLITMNIKKNNFYYVVVSHFVFFADYI